MGGIRRRKCFTPRSCGEEGSRVGESYAGGGEGTIDGGKEVEEIKVCTEGVVQGDAQGVGIFMPEGGTRYQDGSGMSPFICLTLGTKLTDRSSLHPGHKRT